ncbi:MAG: isoprenylcysteine carboxylmethyltransferase family protein, partial [Nitrospirae bacterium]
MNTKRTALGSAIVLYFIIGLEILIMISPFAGFFYSVFNPFLLALAKHPATRWLSAFYLPHMVVPPDGFLKTIRVLGSVLFVAGMLGFFICAVQVYTNKFLKRGAALGGLYSFIRHPQYLCLALAGLGLCILWPRFLVAVLWVVMVGIYYLLSKDEERRMLRQFPEVYREYMKRTGMFLPGRFERFFSAKTIASKVMVYLLLGAVVIGGAFLLRSYTVRHLPLWHEEGVVAVSILPEDLPKMNHRMLDILKLPEVRTQLKKDRKYLVYVMPVQYIMQGLIADTGTEWRLYKHHHTISMITDWIIHPFRHLRQGHHHMDEHGHSHPTGQNHQGVLRRLIFLEIEDAGALPYGAFGIRVKRTPRFMADIEFHNLKLLQI